MKIYLSVISIILFSTVAIAQDKSIQTFVLGEKEFSVEGYELFAGNNAEYTYYEVIDGVLHYHYINMYEGQYIQYNHASVPCKSINLKDMKYSDYDEIGKFMYIKTKKLVKDVKQETYYKMSAEQELKSEVNTKFTMIMLITSEEQGKMLESLIKKSK